MSEQTGDKRGEGGGAEVDEIVAQEAAAFEGGAEERVKEQTEDAGEGCENEGARRACAGEGDEKSAEAAGEGAAQGDAAVCAGWCWTEGGEHEGGTGSGLTDFGGKGVGGGLGERSESGDGRAGGCAESGYAKVGENLRGTSAVPCFRQTALFLAGATEAGRREGEKKEQDEGEQKGRDGAGRSAGERKREADDGSEQGRHRGRGAQSPGAQAEQEAEQERDGRCAQRVKLQEASQGGEDDGGAQNKSQGTALAGVPRGTDGKPCGS